MSTTENGDNSVLQLFDPLKTPVKSYERTKTQRTRERDPQSPVAAFFSTVDKSRHFLATREKPQGSNLIDLGVPQSPPPRRERVEDASSARVSQHTFATPAPLNEVLMNTSNNPNGHGPVNFPIDPFSPPTNTGTPNLQSIVQIPQLVLTQEDEERNRLIPVDTPTRPDLFTSTNFTPVPENLPYLPESSLGSLVASVASSTGTRRRRSSVDLENELYHSKPDSSFDILRGEMELASVDTSFVSVNARDPAKALECASVEESPWTMKSDDIESDVDHRLLQAKETPRSTLLAHENLLPDICQTSPESPTGYNEAASAHASKVFSNLRRPSMAKVDEDALAFPSDDTSLGKEVIPPKEVERKLIPHVRTMSITSVSSVTSSRSAITVKQSTSPSEKRMGYRRTMVKRPSALTSTSSSPAKPISSSKRISRPSMLLKGASSRLSLAGPRASLAIGRTAPVGRASMAPRPSSVGTSMAPPPIPSASSARTALGTRPRMSIASASGRPSISQPIASRTAPFQKAAASKTLVASKSVLTSGIRANSNAARVSRLSTVGASAPTLKPTAVTKVDIQSPSVPATVRPRVGPVKPRPSSMIVSSLPMNTQASVSQRTVVPTASKSARNLHRPRTSSAGAALISRPPLMVDPPVSATARPRSVATQRLLRPKSSLSRV